jgi:hypothetical protein
MTTDFFEKKRLFRLLVSILVGIVFTVFSYAVYLAQAKTIWIGKGFYFLVSSNVHTEAATHSARLEGGAGYILEDKEKTHVVYSVYLNETDVNTIQENIDTEIALIKKEIRCLSFKGNEKGNEKLYIGALNTLYSCIEIIENSVSMLERGTTQEACKRILSLLERQFGYMASTYQGKYDAFSNVCTNIHQNIKSLLAHTVFCKDLRYLLCEACEGYIQLASVFSL